MLRRIGPSAMTMDMVARSCGISKRTLYEVFADKKTLILDCLMRDHQQHETEFKQIFETADNCFDALFKAYMKVRHDMESNASIAFTREIKRMYPDVHSEHERNEKHFVKGLGEMLHKAQDEGHVIKHIDTEIAAFLFLSTMRGLHESERIEAYGFNEVDVFDGAFMNFLRGIATVEGIEFIDNHVREMREELNNKDKKYN